MQFFNLVSALFASAAAISAVVADPVLNARNADALTSPLLDRRSDTVLTLDGRLVSRQDVRILIFLSVSVLNDPQCCEDPPGCGCSSAVSGSFIEKRLCLI